MFPMIHSIKTLKLRDYQSDQDFASNFFFEKQEVKSKEQNSGKTGENLGKWVSENCKLAYFALQRWRYSTRIVTNRI